MAVAPELTAEPSRIDRQRHIWRRFAPHVRRRRGALIGALACVVATTAFELAQPWPMKLLFDGVLLPGTGARLPEPLVDFAGRDPNLFVAFTCLAFVAIAVLHAGAAYWAGVLGTEVGHRVVAGIRADLYLHMQRLSLSFHQRSRTGDLLMRLTGDVQLLKELLVDAVFESAGALLTFLAMATVMLWLDWRLGLAGLALLPLVGFVSARLSSRLRDVVGSSRRKEGRLAGSLGESLNSVAVIQAYGGEEVEASRFVRQNRSSLRAGLRAARLKAALTRTVDLLVAAGTGLVLWLGTLRVLAGQVSPGDLLVFIAYLRSAYRPVRNVGRLAIRWAKAQASAERILEVLDQVPDVQDRVGARAAPPLRGEIVLDGVGFSYGPGPRVLHDIDIRLAPGTLTALVGSSGAGKSTLASLLPRFFDPTRGVVRIDGVDIRDFTLASLRSQMTFVLQDSVIFGISVRDNVTYGAADASDSAVWEALQLANADEFVARMPEKLDTVIGERGATLSGGERQRLALARAALRRTPILILDEPTTSLDAESAERVDQALARLTRGVTTLVIAHNLAVVRRAGHILFLEGGQIVEQGSHENLIRTGGPYSRFYRLQSSGFAEHPPLEERPRVAIP